MTTSTAVARATVPSDDLARVAANALAFLPARSQHKTARLTLAPGVLTITATDGYALGMDSCPADVDGSVTVDVDRDGLAELDKAGRADKKFSGVIEVYPLDAVRFVASDTAVTAVKAYESDADLWEMVDDLLLKLPNTGFSLPKTVALDPTLLMRFSKVKADKATRIADFHIADPESPVLVKIGTTFVGCIMPIDRGVHAENVGPEGLWA